MFIIYKTTERGRIIFVYYTIIINYYSIGTWMLFVLTQCVCLNLTPNRTLVFINVYSFGWTIISKLILLI